MARCNYCGRESSENTFLQVGGNGFCNNLCMHSFENNGNKPNEGAVPGQPRVEMRQEKSKMKATVLGAITTAVVAAVVGQLTTGFMQNDFAGLREFKAPDNSFTVMLPKDVIEEKQAVNTHLGPIECVSYYAKAKYQEFTIAYSDYPDSFVTVTAPEVLLDGSRDGAVRNIQGTLLSETIIDIDGHPGRELRIEGPEKSIIKFQMYFVEQRLYQILAVSKPAHSFDKKIDEVFGSFKINGI